MAEPAAQNITLYVALISAGAALFGTVGGGLISFLTTYFLKKKEWQQGQVATEIEKREALYSEFMSEAGKRMLLSIDRIIHQADEMSEIYALLGKIRMRSSPAVVEAAESFTQRIMQSLRLRAGSKDEVENPSVSRSRFSDACRTELQNLRRTGVIH
jgi:hypothetical protein